jgi:hypothetical protein
VDDWAWAATARTPQASNAKRVLTDLFMLGC